MAILATLGFRELAFSSAILEKSDLTSEALWMSPGRCLVDVFHCDIFYAFEVLGRLMMSTSLSDRIELGSSRSIFFKSKPVKS